MCDYYFGVEGVYDDNGDPVDFEWPFQSYSIPAGSYSGYYHSYQMPGIYTHSGSVRLNLPRSFVARVWFYGPSGVQTSWDEIDAAEVKEWWERNERNRALYDAKTTGWQSYLNSYQYTSTDNVKQFVQYMKDLTSITIPSSVDGKPVVGVHWTSSVVNLNAMTAYLCQHHHSYACQV